MMISKLRMTLCKRHHKIAKDLVCRIHGASKPGPSRSSIPDIVSSHRQVGVSEIIDVRTPAEFHEDRIPGSINLPVLSNEERVVIGTMYRNDNFKARKVGAALIGRNISHHLEQYFETKSPDFSPLVYCWRGGQRSFSLAMVLSQIGFKTFTLEGGYKQYREQVRQELSTLPEQFQFKCVAGLTGSGKTHILAALRSHGHQVLDLECLAKHKGSMLGLWHGETQPSQKYFESLLVDELHQFSTSKPVWLESESKSIGFVAIPEVLFSKLQTAERYSVTLPMEQRVKHIIKDYPNWSDDRETLKGIVGKLVKHQGHKRVEEWLEMIDNVEKEKFVESLLVHHYDPAYSHSQKKNNLSSGEVKAFDIPDLEEETLGKLVEHLTQETDQSETACITGM